MYTLPASLSYQVHRVNGDLAVSRGFGDAEYVDGKSEREKEREKERERRTVNPEIPTLCAVCCV